MGKLDRFNKLCEQLENGEVRVAEKVDGEWKVNRWVKETILEGFKYGEIVDMTVGRFGFFDKNSVPPRKFGVGDKIRIVPGGTSIRRGAYLAPSVVVMPPSYVNIGAYVDAGSMIDSHVTVGSCAQVGKEVHVSAAAQLGGVLEPVGALPVIIEDNVFIGGGCGIYEGTVVREGAVIAGGVIITRGTPIYDAVNDKFIVAEDGQGRIIVPENAVVIMGSRPIGNNKRGIHAYMPVIIKYRDEKTSASVSLEEDLR